MVKVNLFGLFADEIAEMIKPHGLEEYRGRQIAEWMYRKYCRSFADMTNLSKPARQILAGNFLLEQAVMQNQQHSQDKSTSKFLLGFSDGAAVETVLMRHGYGNSVCVSTQVGCGMGCIFCASTIGGMVRSLTCGEILAQVLFINEHLGRENARVDSLVLMGSGEPLLNYDNVLKFIRLCHESYCLNMGFRSFTLSTAGIVPGIDRLAEEGLPITLAVSLHAPDNCVRSQLMPINKKYPLESVLAATDRYSARTGRRVTFEYTLLAGVNDSDRQATELSQIMRERLANVNLIPVNPVVERGVKPPDNKRIDRFVAILRKHRVNVTVRREMGADIRAACGQLRRAALNMNPNGERISGHESL